MALFSSRLTERTCLLAEQKGKMELQINLDVSECDLDLTEVEADKASFTVSQATAVC